MGILGRSTVEVRLPPPTEEERQLQKLSVKLADEQLSAAERQSELADFLFENMPELFESLRGSGALDEDALGEELEALRTGSATTEQKQLISDAVSHALELGESDINRFMQSGLERVRDVLAPERGLRPGDSPIMGLGSDITEEGQRMQGQLVNQLRGYEADTLLNMPFERGLATTQLQAQLQQEAFNNRLRLTGATGSLGLGMNPNFNVPQALSVIQAPRLAMKETVSKASLGQLFDNAAGAYANWGSGTESFASAGTSFAAMCWVAAEYYGWFTPEWFAARRWIAERWEGRVADIFRATYLRHGRRVAAWVRKYRPVRWALRPVFAWAVRKGQ